MSPVIKLRPPPGADERTVALYAELERQLGLAIAHTVQRIEARVLELESEPVGFEVKRVSFTARAGQVVTVEPPPAGLTVTLPAASAVTRGARVVVTAKNANPVRWEAARGLVNGVRQVTSNAPGAAEAICDAEAWHVSIGAATPTGSSASTAGATFFLESSDTGLPNARVADDSTEIDLSYTTPGVVSWFLKTASVVLGKLQDLTGLSVLGRAANSSGVMAAITATAARQVLRANDAGTSLEWGNPIQVSDSGADIGDFFNVDFADGNGLGVAVTDAGSGRAVVTYGWDGLYVYDGASFVNYFQGLQFNDGTGLTATVSDNSPTGTVTIAWDGTSNLVTGWAGVLAKGATSGANNPQVDVGQHVNFGLTGPTTSNPQIRSGDATFRIRGGGNLFMLADGAAGIAAVATTGASSTALLQAQGAGSVAAVDGGDTVQISSGGIVRLVIASTGEWTMPASGASGRVLTHQGAGAPPLWALPFYSTVRDNGSAETQRHALNFLSSTSVIFTGTDDAANDETELSWQRAALSGVVVAAQNVNATTFGAGVAGVGLTLSGGDTVIDWDGVQVRKNSTGSTFTRRRLNLIEGTNVTLTMADDAANDEVDVTVAAAATPGWDDVLAVDRTSGANNPQVNTSQFLEFGSTGTLPATGGQIQSKLAFRIASRLGMTLEAGDGSAGDLTLLGDNITIQSNLASTNFVDVNCGDFTVDASDAVDIGAGSGDLILTGGLTSFQLRCASGTSVVRVCSGASGTASGFLSCVESATSAPTVSAGEGMFWVRNDAPNVPMFTDDTNVDHQLLYLDALSSTHHIAQVSAGSYGFRKSRQRGLFWDEFDFVAVAGAGSTVTTAGVELDNWFYQGIAASCTVDVQAGESNHPGIVRLTTGSAASGNGARMYRGDVASTTLPITAQDVLMFECIARLSSAASVAFELGFTDALGGSPSNAILFAFNSSTSANVRAFCREAGVSTDTDTGTAPGTGWNVYTLLQETAGTVDFYIDDVLEATTSTNVPDTEGVNVGAQITTLTNAAKSLDVDYIMYELGPLGTRTS